MEYFILLICMLNIATSLIYWRKIMGTQAEAAVELRNLKVQVERNRTEVLAKISALEAAAGGNTTPEFDAALADLKTSVQASDDDVA